MRKNLLLLFVAFMVACSPKIKTTITQSLASLDYESEVFVIGLNEKTPESAVKIGTVKIGDSGLSVNCGWNIVIEKAKLEARKAGGNAIKIISHTPPSIMGSSCDRITALILKIDTPAELSNIKGKQIKKVDSTWKYAKLYVYRPSASGFIVGYDLFIGDSLLCRVKSNSKQEIKITQEGLNSLWAKTETKSEIPIEIEYGREYYLRCSIGIGVMVGRPKLQLIDNESGSIEYNSLNSK